MSFAGLTLSEIALRLGLFGGAMVLLYLLRVRRRTVIVPFSPLWARALDKSRAASLFQRLQRLSSLLLQLLIVSLVVLALADPRPGASGAGCRHEATPTPPSARTLILVDTSASMGVLEDGRPRLHLAIDAVETALSELPRHAGHAIMLATFDQRARPLTPWTAERAILDKALAGLRRLSPPPLGTDLPGALAFAADTLRAASADDSAANLLVASDFAFELPAEGEGLPPFWALPVGGPVDNLGIEAFNVRPLPDDPLTYVAWFSVRSDLDRPVEADLLLYADPDGRRPEDFERAHRLIETVPLTLEPGASRQGRIEHLKFEGDRLMARLVPRRAEAIRDSFAADDIAFAVSPERRPLRVTLVTAGNAFLEAALSLRENVRLSLLSPGALRALSPEAVDVLILDGVPGAAGLSIPTLRIAPPDREKSGEAKDITPALAARQHPIVRGLSTADWGIAEMPLFKTDKGDTILIHSAQGPRREPVLWVREGSPREATLAFDLRRSLLPMQIAFPVLVVNLLNWLNEEPDDLHLPLPAGGDLGVALPFEADRVDVTDPRGQTQPATVIAGRARVVLDAAGIYTLTPAGRAEPRHTIAVNLGSPAESALSPRPVARVEGAQPPAEGEASLPEAPADPDLWRWLLMATLCLLAFDQLAWHRRWTA